MAPTTPTRLSAARGRRRAAAVTERIYLTYPTRLIREPVIYELGVQFALRTNVRGANVSDIMGSRSSSSALARRSRAASTGCGHAA